MLARNLEHFGHILKLPTSGGGRRAQDGARVRGRPTAGPWRSSYAPPPRLSAPQKHQFGLPSLKTMTWKRGRAVAAPSSSAPAGIRDRAPRWGRQRAPPPARPRWADRGCLRPRRGVQADTGELPRPHTETWPTHRLLDRSASPAHSFPLSECLI